MSCGYAYVVVGPDGKCIKKKLFVEKILSPTLLKIYLKKKMTILAKIKPMNLTLQEEKVFKNAQSFSICQKALR